MAFDLDDQELEYTRKFLKNNPLKNKNKLYYVVVEDLNLLY